MKIFFSFYYLLLDEWIQTKENKKIVYTAYLVATIYACFIFKILFYDIFNSPCFFMFNIFLWLIIWIEIDQMNWNRSNDLVKKINLIFI